MASVWVSDRRTQRDFAEVLRRLADEVYPDAEKIVMVTDDLNTHHLGVLDEAFEPHETHRLDDRFDWHYTPEHGSWLNITECELSILTRQCLDRRIPDKDTLTREVQAWESRDCSWIGRIASRPSRVGEECLICQVWHPFPKAT